MPLFFFKGSDPFPPNITQTEYSTVCIQSKSPDDWSPVQRTQVVIYDSTRDIIQNTTEVSDNFCEDFRDFPQTCAPFTISATAYTRCTQSPTTDFYSELIY